jgi:CRP-like cAMP-binding protein
MLNTIASVNETPRAFHPAYMDRTAAGHSPYGMPVIDNCLTCKLRNNNFSCALSKPSLEGLDQIKHAAAYPEGAFIFVEGQTPRGVYILCQGHAKLMTTTSDGRSLIVKIAQPGDILGLHAVVSGKPYELTVETLQPSRLAFIGRDDFLRFLKSHGDACLQAANAAEPGMPVCLSPDSFYWAKPLDLGKDGCNGRPTPRSLTPPLV